LSSESYDRTTPTPVLLVGVDFGFPHFDGELEELGLLAGTAGLRPVARLTCKRKVPDAALFVGSGKADEIRMLAQMHGAQEVLFDQALSPAQQRNLERHLQMPVNDRTLLILEIFAQRARSQKASCRWNWRACNTWPRASCGAGPTWNARWAASGAVAALAKSRSNWTAA
jgi:GTP-binding protein HflX